MIFVLKTTRTFEKSFRKLDNPTQKMLKSWIDKNLLGTENPRLKGKVLAGQHKGKIRYRIGKYRLICSIIDSELIIMALDVGHRKNIYM